MFVKNIFFEQQLLTEKPLSEKQITTYSYTEGAWRLLPLVEYCVTWTHPYVHKHTQDFTA